MGCSFSTSTESVIHTPILNDKSSAVKMIQVESVSSELKIIHNFSKI